MTILITGAGGFVGREIVRRLVTKAPALGEDGWARVVEAVITASLDAAERGR